MKKTCLGLLIVLAIAKFSVSQDVVLAPKAKSTNILWSHGMGDAGSIAYYTLRDTATARDTVTYYSYAIERGNEGNVLQLYVGGAGTPALGVVVQSCDALYAVDSLFQDLYWVSAAGVGADSCNINAESDSVTTTGRLSSISLPGVGRFIRLKLLYLTTQSGNNYISGGLTKW